jgi:segregation and condensation protein B
MNESHIRNVIEAALLAAGKPLQPAELVELFDEGARPQLQDVTAALTALMAEYSNRGIEIKETAAGFRIQVRREMANEISRLWPERPARYSRALLETLALIAYRQPITRAEIEAVRGVAVNPNILKTVIERNWVRVVGHRDVPGRPELLGTTRDFLDYFGLKNLDELPPLAELKTIVDIKVQFDLPDPGPIPLASEANSEAGTPEPAAEHASTGEGTPAAGTDGKEAVSEEVVQHSAVADETSAHDTSAHETTTHDAASEAAIAPRQARASDTALHEAEEFAASVDADLAAGDDDGSDDDELSAAGPDSSELVAGPRDIDD